MLELTYSLHSSSTKTSMHPLDVEGTALLMAIFCGIYIIIKQQTISVELS